MCLSAALYPPAPHATLVHFTRIGLEPLAPLAPSDATARPRAKALRRARPPPPRCASKVACAAPVHTWRWAIGTRSCRCARATRNAHHAQCNAQRATCRTHAATRNNSTLRRAPAATKAFRCAASQHAALVDIASQHAALADIQRRNMQRWLTFSVATRTRRSTAPSLCATPSRVGPTVGTSGPCRDATGDGAAPCVAI